MLLFVFSVIDNGKYKKMKIGRKTINFTFDYKILSNIIVQPDI